ncbi:glutathione S-transferase family protein [Novosphingobium beihaiensis]|uniref:Glutathione S-transferase family protein n=1 Tax=Novosphingobium beihaiensis TaxID=2930389 RepID=A0ABT0BLR6_9SPHN|nr:glutathione S-transferase family protein [Novosphingobium beihaiensis]MCJ2185992.1 glutathione S-transferase family protein [Novosphingobium beihaiensis]
MKLIGMLDSPYVRRVAVSLTMQGIPFAHQRLSVLSEFDAFAAVNPVVKAPTLITGDGVMLMDSTLILEYAARLAGPEHSLVPNDLPSLARAQRITGLALAACEKTVQIVYERNLRPPEKQHEPWLDRVHGQLAAAYRLLEEEIREAAGPWLFGNRPLQADITSAVAFRFTRDILSGTLDAKTCPALAALWERAEGLEAFKAFPYPS